MAATRSPLSARLRALASNPRVIAIVVLAGVGALYLRHQQAQSAGSQLVGDTLPVEPSSATDAFGGTDLSSGIGVGTPEYHDPITLSPGDSVYDPNTGKFITAPNVPDIAETQVPDATGGQTAAAAPGNVIAVNIARAAGNWKLPKTQTSHLPSGFDPSPIVRRALGKAAISRATQIAHLGRVGNDRLLPALAHPPSRSNVKRAAHVVSGANVRTAAAPPNPHRPAASPAIKRAFPKVHAGAAREGPAAHAPVRTAKPVSARTARGSAASALVSRPVPAGHPAAAARRDVVKKVVAQKKKGHK